MKIKGWLPNRLTITLERGKEKSKLFFKEWHEYATREEFDKINRCTQVTAKKLKKAYTHLKLDVKFKTYPKEKSYEMTYVGKDIRPAISGIIWELMPLLVSNKDEAFHAIDTLFQAVKWAVSFEDLSSVKEH